MTTSDHSNTSAHRPIFLPTAPVILTGREWGVACLIALSAVSLTLLPYLLGYTQSQPGFTFTGLLMNPEDSQTYWAKMLQGFDGQWRYTIPFTPEPHEPAFLGVFYLWLGHLARWFGLSLTAVWHLSRVLAGLVMFLVTYRFIATFLSTARARWIAYLLAIFGSGLGWLLFALGQTYWLDAFPIDFKQPEAHLFFTALTFPHAAVGTALILLSIWCVWQIGQPTVSHPWRYAVAAGLLNVALGIAYPFLIYLILLTTTFYWTYLAWRARRILWREGRLLAISFLIAAPLYLYYAYVLRSNAVFHAWDVQAVTTSAPWPHYLLAYGPMLLLGIWHWRARPAERHQFAILWLWIVAAALLLYAPLNPQRRFVQGVQVPLSIIAAAAFVQVVLPRLEQTRPFQALLRRPRYSAEKMRPFLTLLFLLFMSLSNLYVLADASRIAALEQPDPLFRPTDEVIATQWLRANGEATAVVLGSYQTGNHIAAHAGQRVVLGHWAETMDYERKTAEVARFYDGATADTWRRDLLARYSVGYIWHGPRELALGGFDPGTADYLRPVYTHDTITIYVVLTH